MNHKVRESLSAVMDGEGDELALRRVLKSLDSSPEEANTWRRYHVIGSIMRREHDIDVTMDISTQVMMRIEAQQPAGEVAVNDIGQSVRGGVATKRGFGRFSFMGNAAVAAAVSLMVITGVQVYRGGHSSVPGSNAMMASQSSGMASIADRANMPSYSNSGSSDLSTVGLASEPVNQSYASNDSSLMSSYSSQMSNNEAKRQARLLQGFLDLHAQDADFQPQGQYSTINAGFMGTASKQVSLH